MVLPLLGNSWKADNVSRPREIFDHDHVSLDGVVDEI